MNRLRRALVVPASVAVLALVPPLAADAKNFHGTKKADTVKGTHGRGVQVLGGGRVRIDMNYLYNPSCAYDDRWLCPLAPPENTVRAAIRAGEMTYH